MIARDSAPSFQSSTAPCNDVATFNSGQMRRGTQGRGLKFEVEHRKSCCDLESFSTRAAGGKA